MSVFLQGYQLRELLFGTPVNKAAQVLPSNTTGGLYTVSGGAVLVTSLLGHVSTACGTAVTTLALGFTPLTGTAENSGIATATAVTSLEKGTWVAPQPSSEAAGALVSGGHAGNAVFPPSPFVVAAGTITATTNNTNLGAFDWYLNYVPLDTGASVS